mgnify:FL=1
MNRRAKASDPSEIGRDTTRKAIIVATGVVLRRLGYAGTTVEQIITEAQVARATFYAYFQDKRSAVVELVAVMWARVRNQYEQFAAMPRMTPDNVEEWLWFVHSRWARYYREVEAMVRDLPSDIASAHTRNHADFVSIVVGDGGKWACSIDRARCRAHLLIGQLERAMSDLFRKNIDIDEGIVIEELAGIWWGALTRP